jgi:ABC-type phosphonate transport system ATPase subunit
MASIVDRPKISSEGDLLEIEKYTNGLIQFIEHSATPITIGVQGEWGSGKTSLLNTIKQDLCDKEGAEHYPVWINTWKYSLLSSPDETLIKIISGLVNQIGELTKNQSSEKGKKLFGQLGNTLKDVGGVIGGVGGRAIEMTGKMIEASTIDKPANNSVEALQNALQAVINEAIGTSDKKAFIFFIDDLDRLDPAVAVNILELIKNIFDLEKCIFVLAIDYGVVIKGLVPKFGKMTDENEWEFRAFFDKIIQLPFSMPVANYNIGKYLQSLLVNVNYFTKGDLDNKETIEKIAEIVSFSVGTNPRALKRLANSVSLIEIIRGDEKITSDERVIEFALICIQIAYPIIYGLIQKDSDFTQWNEQVVYGVLKNKKIDSNDLEILKDTEEFDEEWEQNLWKICQVSSFLKQRTYQLSKLLNFIKENVPNVKSEDMGETLDRLLSMSSVTSVSAESVADGTKKKFEKTKYEGLDAYIEFLNKNKKNLKEKVIKNLKELIYLLENEFGDTIEITYAPSNINIKNLNSKKRGKVFVYISIYTSKIKLCFLDIYDLIESQNLNDKIGIDRREISNNVDIYIEENNSVNFEEYLPCFKLAYEKLEEGS